jgi:hypothetical protein
MIIRTILCTLCLLAASSPAGAQQSRSFYDRNGSFAGSATTRGNTTSFTDRAGRFDGTAIPRRYSPA